MGMKTNDERFKATCEALAKIQLWRKSNWVDMVIVLVNVTFGGEVESKTVQAALDLVP